MTIVAACRLAERAKTSSDAHRAVWWMAGAAVGYGALPLLIWAGLKTLPPFMFLAVFFAATGASHAVLRQAEGRGGMRGNGPAGLVIASDVRATRPFYLILLALSKGDWILYVVAVSLCGPVIATIIAEFWPAVFGAFTCAAIWRARMLRNRGTRSSAERVGEMVTLMFIGGAAVGLAVVSESDVIEWSAQTAVGALFAVGACVSSALSAAVSLILGQDRRYADSDDADNAAVSASANAFVHGALAPPLAIAAVALFAAGSTDALWSSEGALFAAAAGAVQVCANWGYYRGGHLAVSAHQHTAAKINSIYYSAPVIALMLLVWVANSHILRPELLIVGMAGVIVVNLTIHFGSQRGTPFWRDWRALLLATWGITAVAVIAG